MKWKFFCPSMKEMCVNGHCQSMGQDEDKEPIRCVLWAKVAGVNPQTGQKIEEWKCSKVWATLLQIENSQQIRMNTASIDKMSNQIDFIKKAFLIALPEEKRLEILTEMKRLGYGNI